MRHNLYANNARVTLGDCKKMIKKRENHTFPMSRGFPTDNTLNIRVSALKERFKDNPRLFNDLKNKYESFVINLSIAQDLKVRDQEKKLRKEFSSYLSKLEKEK